MAFVGSAPLSTKRKSYSRSTHGSSLITTDSHSPVKCSSDNIAEDMDYCLDGFACNSPDGDKDGDDCLDEDLDYCLEDDADYRLEVPLPFIAFQQLLPDAHKSAARPPPTLDTIIGLQSSSGYFIVPSTRLRSHILSYFTPGVIGKLKKHSNQSELLFRWRHRNPEIVYTILIIIFIEVQYPESLELCELVIQKARSWLLEQLKSNETLNELEEIARDEMRKEKDENWKDELDKDGAENLSPVEGQKRQNDVGEEVTS